MRWEAWILAALFAANVCLAPTSVGKPRKPATGGTAAAVAALSAVMLWLTLRLGGVS